MKIIDEIIEKDIQVNKYLDIFKITNSDINYREIKNEEVIFFDIETTGLNVSKTNLYLIGFVYFKDSKWHYCQLFGDSIKDEESILLKFETICSSYKYLIHFNGDHFDIPYINEKCNTHGISRYLDNLISIDLYLLVKLYKAHLGLKNCKQKTIEDLLSITREDKFNGGELIPQYFAYMKSHDEELYRNLLLHNAEDCMGMLKLLEITDYIKLVEFIQNGTYDLKISNSKDSDFFSFTLIPDNFRDLENINSNVFKFRNYNIAIANNELVFKTSLYDNELKHFFKDYQNYYYVPSKDTAIHKSVAKFMDSGNREKCKAANCYVIQSGIFIPIFGEIEDTLVFKEDNKSTNNFILFISETDIKDVNDLVSCLKNSLRKINE